MNTPDNCNCNTSAIASAVAPAPMMSTRSSEEQLPVVMPLQTSRPVTAAPVLSLREARGTYLSTAPMEGQGLEVAMATAIASHYELASVREEVTTILRASTLPVSRVPVLLTGRQQDETPGQLYRETSDYNRGLSSRIRMTTEDAARVFPTSKTGLYYTKQSIRRERQYFSFFDVSPAKMDINTAKMDISPAKTDISKIDIGPAKSMVPVALDNDRARHERVNKAAIEDASHAASAAPHVYEVQLRERVVQRLREFVEEGRCSEELLHEVTRQLQAVSAGETSVHAGSVTVPSIGKSALLADSPAKNVLKSAKVVEKEFVDADAVGNANATADNVHPIQKHESMFSMFTTGSKNLRRALTFGSHKRSSLTGNGSRKSVSSDSAATNFAISTNDISPTGPKRVDSDNDLDDEVSILNKSPTAAASSHGSKIYAAYQLALRAGVHASDADELQLKRLGVTSITCKISSHGHRVSKVKSNGSGTQIVKEYSPDIFRRLRAAQNCGEELTDAFRGELKLSGAGKSGSIMFWTQNRSFVAKSMMATEVPEFKRMLDSYVEHIEQNPDSILSRFLGFFKVRTAGFGGTTSYFLIMKNVFENHSGALVDIYDLKGSTVGRFTPACTEEKRRSLTDLFGRERAPASMQVKKDLNFMADNRNFSFGAASECSRFIDIVRKDTEYLKSLGVLDYSLLVGVRESGFWEAGIIDFLTPYSLRKKAEHLFVGGVKGRKTISCVPPAQYAARFLGFVETYAAAASPTAV